MDSTLESSRYMYGSYKQRWEARFSVITDEFNPVQDGEQKGSPYQFFPCNFYKRRN